MKQLIFISILLLIAILVMIYGCVGYKPVSITEVIQSSPPCIQQFLKEQGAPMAINAGAFYSIDETTDTNPRFRISAGDTTGPALAGAALTFAGVRALGSLGVHRYIRFGVNCPSPDGLTQVAAAPCYIGITPPSGYPRGRD